MAISRISMRVGWLILWNQSGHNQTKVATEIKKSEFFSGFTDKNFRIFETGGPFSTKMQLSYDYDT